MEFTRRGGQHGGGGMPLGRLHRPHGDEVAVERSGRLPRYKPDCLHFKHQIRQRTDSPWRTSPRLRPLILPSTFYRFLLFSAFHAESGGEEYKNRYRKKFRPLPWNQCMDRAWL